MGPVSEPAVQGSVTLALSLPCSPTWCPLSLYLTPFEAHSSLQKMKDTPASYLFLPSITNSHNSVSHTYTLDSAESGVLTSSHDDCGVWSILRVGFSLLLVSKPIFFKSLCHRGINKSKVVMMFQKCSHFGYNCLCSGQGAPIILVQLEVQASLCLLPCWQAALEGLVHLTEWPNSTQLLLSGGPGLGHVPNVTSNWTPSASSSAGSWSLGKGFKGMPLHKEVDIG